MKHTLIAGDDWVLETTLTDSAGAPITALDDAWISIYSNKTGEVLGKALAHADVTLASNVLTCLFNASETTAVADGSYLLDVKIDVTTGYTQTVTFRDTVKVHSKSPLFDDY